MKNNIRFKTDYWEAAIRSAIISVTSYKSVFLTIDIITAIKTIYLADIATPPSSSWNASIGRFLKKEGFVKIRTINVRDYRNRRSHSAEWQNPHMITRCPE